MIGKCFLSDQFSYSDPFRIFDCSGEWQQPPHKLPLRLRLKIWATSGWSAPFDAEPDTLTQAILLLMPDLVNMSCTYLFNVSDTCAMPGANPCGSVISLLPLLLLSLTGKLWTGFLVLQHVLNVLPHLLKVTVLRWAAVCVCGKHLCRL